MNPAVLLATPPPADAGIPLDSGDTSARFVVEVTRAGSDSVLGDALPLTLSSARWVDVTADVQGLTWTSGGPAGQRVIAGELSVRLDNAALQHSRAASIYNGPGSLVRVWCDGPEYVGITQAWRERSHGIRHVRWVDVVCWQTIYLIGEVNDLALDTAVGAGETFGQRVDRIVTAAAYKFAVTRTEPVPAMTMQATNLAQDLLTELYLSADSVGGFVWVAKQGKLQVAGDRIGHGIGALGTALPIVLSGVHLFDPARWTLGGSGPDGVPVVEDSVLTDNDEANLLSRLTLARVGGTAHVYENPGVRGRYRPHTSQRLDLITTDDDDLDVVAEDWLGRSREPLRPVSADIEAGAGRPVETLFLQQIDVNYRVNVQADGFLFSGYRVCQIAHSITPIAAGVGVDWRAKILFDVTIASTWEVSP